MNYPTILQATTTEVIVQHYKAIQFEILLLHQWRGGATRKSLSGIVLAAVVVKDLQLNYLCRTVDDMLCHYPSPDSQHFL